MGCALAAGPVRWSGRMSAAALLVSVVLTMTATAAMCPPQCLCRNDPQALVTASCNTGRLEVFPIQLNPDVQNIDLSGNKISSVVYTLMFYIKLHYLDLSRNKIPSLGSRNFDRQEQLTFLNISFNQITRLGKNTFKGLKVLKVLDLSHNSIESVEGSAFNDTVELEVLNLSNNNFTSFSDPLVFKNLKNLKVLYLVGNQIIDVPTKALLNLPQRTIEVLDLSNNYIDQLDDLSFPSSMSSLLTLSLASNAVSSVHRSAFNSLHSLKRLDFSDNNLTIVPTEQLAKLSQLTYLDLSENMFSELPAVSFQSLFHLKVLRLSRMPRLVRIDSRAFVDNIHLEIVLMEENHEMKTLPARLFHGNLHLRHVSFRANSLRSVDASHFPLDSMRSLDVSENPLECNCSLLWLWTLARQQDVPSNDTEHLSVGAPQCSSPPPLQGRLLADTPSSAVRCDTPWLTVAAVTAAVLVVFAVSAVLVLLFGDRSLFSCRRSKPPSLDADAKHLPPSIHNGAPPVVMLMPPTKQPWPTMDYSHNDYVTAAARKPAHVVYV